MDAPGLAAKGGVAPRFFSDRNLGHRVPAALRGRGWLVDAHDDHFGEETTDAEIFLFVSRQGMVLLTQDRRIRTRAPERYLLLEAGIGTISVSSTANLSAAVTIAVLAKAERAIFETIAKLTPPFIVAVHKDGSLHRLV